MKLLHRLVLVPLLFVLSACTTQSPLDTFANDRALSLPNLPFSTSSGVSEDVVARARELDFLEVRQYVDKGTYNRDAFGQAWTDANTMEYGQNGCDTRNDILKRDLSNVSFSDTKNCVVVTGVLEQDPYTGRDIYFRRGATTSAAVQIDHVVALKNAWNMGADQWTMQERIDFANDPDNLLATDGPANNQKRDKAADSWLVPDNPEFRCEYAARQIHVKSKWGLAVSPTEKRALTEVLKTCS